MDAQTAIEAAMTWRAANPQHMLTGVVLVWAGTAYGWKDRLRDPQHERPGVLAATYTPGCFEEFADLVVPELQRRGRFRERYAGPTLRENLLQN